MEKIGIEPIQFLTQVLNFSLMVLVLWKILYKPILKVLDERKKKIEQGLKYTEEMKAEQEKLEQKKNEILAKAQKEAQKIIDEGVKRGKEVEREIIQVSHQEAGRIIEAGKKEIARERDKMHKQLQKDTIEIASNLTEKMLSDILTSADHKKIIDQKLKEVEKLQR